MDQNKLLQSNDITDGGDYTEEIITNKRIVVYETSDAPEQGFYKWEIHEYDHNLLGWFNIASADDYDTFDTALRTARHAAINLPDVRRAIDKWKKNN